MNPGNHTELTPMQPVFLLDRFVRLHTELMSLLRSLSGDDWSRPTACALWSVKDVVAHLLDSSIRRLSFGRDTLPSTPDTPISSYADLVQYLNRLNAEWVTACRRLSPRVLMDFLDFTAAQVHAFFQSLDPYTPALFPVAWAGEDVSPNWFDIGREYTERWLHQQQIREAVGAPGLTGREWLHPTLDVFVRALPYTYREVEAAPARSVRFEILGEAGGVWTLVRKAAGWELFNGSSRNADAVVRLDQDTAWKLFSKGLRPDAARQRVKIDGERSLAEPVLGSLAIMA
jgi:uncharacterized protein (TIGR03083 family)